MPKKSDLFDKYYKRFLTYSEHRLIEELGGAPAKWSNETMARKLAKYYADKSEAATRIKDMKKKDSGCDKAKIDAYRRKKTGRGKSQKEYIAPYMMYLSDDDKGEYAEIDKDFVDLCANDDEPCGDEDSLDEVSCDNESMTEESAEEESADEEEEVRAARKRGAAKKASAAKPAAKKAAKKVAKKAAKPAAKKTSTWLVRSGK